MSQLIWFLYLMINNLHWLFNGKAIFLKEQKGVLFNHSLGNKGVHSFPMGISLKVNVIK